MFAKQLRPFIYLNIFMYGYFFGGNICMRKTQLKPVVDWHESISEQPRTSLALIPLSYITHSQNCDSIVGTLCYCLSI